MLTQVIYSDHESTILSGQIFLNQQNKNWNDKLKKLMPIFAQYYQESNSNYPTNYKTNAQKMINQMPKSTHPTSTHLSYIFMGTNIDLNLKNSPLALLCFMTLCQVIR